MQRTAAAGERWDEMSHAVPPDPSLAALLTRFREGDTEALAAIFDATAPGLFRSALHLAPDAASAEDALQETFLAFIEAARGAAPIRDVGPWLAGTLRNKVLRGRRTLRRVPDALRLEPRLLGDDPAVAAERAEEVDRVHRALDDLPETYREVAILRWRYGMEPAAIAHARGVAPGTVRSLLSRAAERLRQGLGALGAVLVGGRPIRGLDAVRSDVLRAARIPAPVAAASAGAILGGVLMAKKAVVACAVLVLLAIGRWFAAGRLATTDEPARDIADVDSSAANAPPAPGRGRSRAPDASETEAVPTAPTLSVREAFPIPSPSGSLLVRVVWEDDGRPADGLWVTVHPWESPDPFLHVLRERTGHDGTAVFPAVHVGRAGIYVATGGAPTPIVEADTRREVLVRAPRGHVVQGTVVDAKGAPVADAVVSDRGVEVVRTVADGTFTLRIGVNGASLGARAPGHAPSAQHRVMGPMGATTNLRLVLPDGGGGSVAGRVLDPDGHPLARARVRVRPWNSARTIPLDDGTWLPVQDAFETTTDAAGRFRLDGIEPVRTVVQARAPRLAPGQSETDVTAGQTVEVDVVLPRGGSVAGTVRDAGGVPITDAVVLAGPYGDFLSQQFHTDAEGRYRLDGLTPCDAYPLSVEAHGKGAASTSIPIAAGVVAEWNPVLSDGTVTTGRVLDGSGRPRAKWSIQMSCMQIGLGWQDSTVTDADGRFTIRNCPNDSLRIAVTAAAIGGEWPKYPSAVRTDVRPGGPAIDITVHDRDLPTAFFAGTVLGADGRPAEGVQIRVRRADEQMSPYHFADPETGRFRVGPLPPGAYDIAVVTKGHPDVRLGRKDVEPNAELDLGTIRLVDGGILEVKAKREGGGTPARIWGEVFAVDGASAGHLTGEGDVARCPALPPGRYRIRVHETVSPTETWMAFLDVEIRAGETTSIDATLAAAGVRTFRAALAAGGAPTGDVRIVVRTVAGAVVYDMSVPLSATRATSLALPIGSYVVEASTGEGLRADARIEVAAAGTADEPVDLVLR